MPESTTLDRLKQLLPQLFQPVEISGLSYLRFQLAPDLPALLSMERVQEALLVPANLVTPLPNMPAFVLGMMSSRDRVFCVIDLGQLLGLEPLLPYAHQYQVVVIHLPTASTQANPASNSTSGQYLGLCVPRIRGVARFTTEPLQSHDGEFPDCLTSYILGCLSDADERTLVLDTVAIADTPALSQNPFLQA